MPFISKEERQKRIDKLQSTDAGKRFFVFLSIIITIAFVVVLMLMQFSSFFGIRDFAANVLYDGEWILWDESQENIVGLTPYGVGMTISACLIVGMLITSFIVFLSMRSLKWGFKETIDLMTQPIPGESGKFATRGKLKRIVGKRLYTSQLKKK